MEKKNYFQYKLKPPKRMFVIENCKAKNLEA